MRNFLLPVVFVVAAATSAFAQEGALDVLDGETLYEDGWLFTTGYEHRTRRAQFQEETTQTVDLSAHYGLLHNLQVGAILPYVAHSLRLDSPGVPARFASDGLGDAALYGKWRYYRWDDVGKALNCSILAGLELPTGKDDRVDHGVILPADLQPGSASWDPFLGTAMTYEPGRWRFNAMVMAKRVGEGTHEYKQGDQGFAELAAGNRFWLEPYPGPFMRADVMLRYRHDSADRQYGRTVADTGGELLTAGVNWAFRPRPTLDLQISMEVPLWEDARGTQPRTQVSFFVAFGIRI